MKTTYFLILSITCSGVFALNSTSLSAYSVSAKTSQMVCLPEKIFQEREDISFNIMMDELARVHRELFQWSPNYDYFKQTVMPEIEAKRKVIAPNYPTREVTGDDASLVKQSFREWYRDYPQESSVYIKYVEEYIALNLKK